MAICFSPYTPHAAPEMPCTAVRPSVHPSLPGSVRPTAAAHREQEADASAVTKMFPAPRSRPATAASSCPSPREPRELPVAPQSHQLMCSPLPRGTKPGGQSKPFWRVNGGKHLARGCSGARAVPWGAAGPVGTGTQPQLGLEGVRCPHDGRPQPQKQQVPGMTPGATTLGWVVGHRGADSPGNSQALC